MSTLIPLGRRFYEKIELVIFNGLKKEISNANDNDNDNLPLIIKKV